MLRSANEIREFGYRTDAQGDYDVMLLSATPDLWFTSLSYAQGVAGRPTDYPLSNMGKAVLRDGRRKMPFSIFANHAFVDGAHLSLLFRKTEEYMREIARA